MSEMSPKAKKRMDDLVTARAVIHPRYLAKESDLMARKWFNYRFLSPLEATILFRNLYTQSLRRYVRENIDPSLAESVVGVQSVTPTERVGWFTQLWDARQRADRLFIPYSLFFSFAFEFAGNRKRRRSPLPIQLLPAESTEDAWWATYYEYVPDRLQYLYLRKLNKLPQYRVEHDRGLPAQRHFRDIVVDRIKTTLIPWHHRVGPVIANRHLSVRDTFALVPEDLKDEVRDRVRSDYERGDLIFPRKEKLDEEDFYPSCFGVEESCDKKLEPCRSCPLFSECTELAAKVSDATMTRTGSRSPVLEADRVRNRRNVAEFRRRRKRSEPRE